MNVDLSDLISLQLTERGTRLDTRHESLAYCPTESEHVADGHLMFRELNPQQNTVTHFIDSITMKALQKSTEYRVFVHEKQYEYERRRLIEQERITESYFLNSLEFIERGEKCEAKAIIDYFTAGFPQVKYFEESRQMMDIIKEEEVEQWGNMFENIGSEKEKIILEVVAEPHCRNQIYENEEEYRVQLHDNSTKESDGITHFLSEQRALDAVNKMFFFFREEESQRLQLEMETVGGNIESAICKANKTVESGKPQYRRRLSKKTMKCVKWMWYEEVLPFQWNNGILELINLLEDNETAGRQKIIEEFSTSYRSLESIETHDILLIISFWAKANNISQNRLNELLFPPGQNMDDKGRNHPFSSRDLQGVLRAIPYIVQEEEALRAKIVLCEDMVFDAKSFMFHYETTDGKDYVFLNYEEGSIRKNIYALYCKMTADLFYYYIDEQRNIFIRHLMSAEVAERQYFLQVNILREKLLFAESMGRHVLHTVAGEDFDEIYIEMKNSICCIEIRENELVGRWHVINQEKVFRRNTLLPLCSCLLDTARHASKHHSSFPKWYTASEGDNITAATAAAFANGIISPYSPSAPDNADRDVMCVTSPYYEGTSVIPAAPNTSISCLDSDIFHTSWLNFMKLMKVFKAHAARLMDDEGSVRVSINTCERKQRKHIQAQLGQYPMMETMVGTIKSKGGWNDPIELGTEILDVRKVMNTTDSLLRQLCCPQRHDIRHSLQQKPTVCPVPPKHGYQEHSRSWNGHRNGTIHSPTEYNSLP